MAALVWIGAAVTLVGLAGIVWCIVAATGARRARLEDEALRARMRRVIVVNFAALMVSALGLVMVVAGVMLG